MVPPVTLARPGFCQTGRRAARSSHPSTLPATLAASSCTRLDCDAPAESTVTYSTTEGHSVIKRVCAGHALDTFDRASALTAMLPGLMVTVSAAV